MKMFVIMGNDFPEGICSTEEKAKAVVVLKKAEEQGLTYDHPRIYWRHYEFDVDALTED